MDLGISSSYGVFIDNEFRETTGGAIDAIDAATGQRLGTFARGTKDDIDAAVRSAQRAFPGWSSLPAEARGAALARLADALEGDLDRHAAIDAADSQGRTVTRTPAPASAARATASPRSPPAADRAPTATGRASAAAASCARTRSSSPRTAAPCAPCSATASDPARSP